MTPPAEKVGLWDVASGKAVREFDGRGGLGAPLTFSPDGRMVAMAADDLSIRLWETANGKVRLSFRAHFNGINALAFRPDGRVLAALAKGDPDDRLTQEAWRSLQRLGK